MSDITSACIPPAALTGSMRDFRVPRGADLLGRTEGFFKWQNLRRQNGLWPFSRATEDGPNTVCCAQDDSGNKMRGVNFASQDYLSLSSHPVIKSIAKETIERCGVHSAGSPALVGNTSHSVALERKIADFLKMQEVVLYPTGWAAGFGVVKGLVRSADHVVMDMLSHSCLQEGAHAATNNIHLFRHLDNEYCRDILAKIRAKDTANGILVVTEALFSMDSDTPDLAVLQELCHEFNATLVVDVAHDLGCLGEEGRGHIGIQNMLGKIDIAAIALEPWFVPDTTSLADQLKAFRRRKTHFALVVDEYGEVMGLVTLEDIIEEIVGDISDEHDVSVSGLRPQADGSVTVDGGVPIRDLNRAMDWNLPDEEATTIAGLVIHEARLIPEPGQTFTFHGFRFRVLRKTRNRITALKVTPLKRPEAKPAEQAA